MVINTHKGHALRIPIGIMMLMLLLGGTANATKIIDDNGGDCTSFGTWKAETMTCTMTTDLTETVQIISNGITLDGNGQTLRGSNKENGIYLYGRTGVIIKNLNTKNFSNGITLEYSNNNTVSSNNISNNGGGITLGNSNNNTVSSNNISNNGGGIGISISGNNMLIYNNASNNGVGISLGLLADNNILIRNIVSNNGIGIDLSYDENGPRNNKLNSNIVSNNRKGIYLFYSSNNELNSNKVSNNVGGICIDDSYGNTLYDNIISNNSEYGLYLYHPALNNSFYDNFFRDNNLISGTQSYWNITRQSGTNIIGGPYIGGNFWADPNGTGFSQTCKDENNDGICDEPYIIDSDNIDYLPLSNLVKPELTVISPNGGEKWKRNKSYKIKWRSSEDTGSYVKIKLLKNGITVKTIQLNTSNDGSYRWKIPNSIVPGTDYRIRITNGSNKKISDISNKNFNIS